MFPTIEEFCQKFIFHLLVPNSDVKKVLQSLFAKKTNGSRNKTPKNVSPRKLFPERSHLSKLLKKKRMLRDAGTVSESDLRKLEALYQKGPAAYGSVANQES